MKEFLEFVAKHLVDNPEDVKVEENFEDGVMVFKLFVNPAETGKIIGKQGKNAIAMRTLLTCIAAKSGQRCSLVIPDVKSQKK